MAVARAGVFEDDGLQPVSRAGRAAVRRAAAALADGGLKVAEAAPRGAARRVRHCPRPRAHDELRRRPIPDDADLTPYTAEMARSGDGFEPSFPAYVAAFRRIAEIDAEAAAWFERHEVALGPAVPDVAAPVGVFTFPPVDGDPMRPSGKLTLSTYASALGPPAVSVPAGRTPDGLPVAVMVIGRRGEDRTLIALAGRLETALGGWLDPDYPAPLAA